VSAVVIVRNLMVSGSWKSRSSIADTTVAAAIRSGNSCSLEDRNCIGRPEEKAPTSAKGTEGLSSIRYRKA